MKVDGVMNPGGPTESALKKRLTAQKSSTLPSHVAMVEQNGERGTLNTTFVGSAAPNFVGGDDIDAPELRGFYGLRGRYSYFAVA
ncbi:hypothetical protein [Terasakiella pusilla]|uniref:hypothetical protein n=1 Tax=Terasakiella pusilla TaxID=64973 RepID=UPI003AA8142D